MCTSSDDVSTTSSDVRVSAAQPSSAGAQKRVNSHVTCNNDDLVKSADPVSSDPVRSQSGVSIKPNAQRNSVQFTFSNSQLSCQHRIATSSDHRIASDASVERRSNKDSLPEFSIEFDTNESESLSKKMSRGQNDCVTASSGDFCRSVSSSLNSPTTQKIEQCTDSNSKSPSNSDVVKAGSCVKISSSLNSQMEQSADRSKTSTSRSVVTTGLRSYSGVCEDTPISSSVSNSCSISGLEPVLGKERMQRLLQNLRHIDLVSTADHHHQQQQHCESSVASVPASRCSETESASHRTSRTCDVQEMRTSTGEEDRRKTTVPEGLREAGTCDAEEDTKQVDDNDDSKMSSPFSPLAADDSNHGVSSSSHLAHHSVVDTTTSAVATEPSDDDDDDDEADSYAAALKRSFRARVNSVKRSLLQQSSDLRLTRPLTSSRDLELRDEGNDDVRDSENFVYDESEGQKRAALAGFPDALRRELIVDLAGSVDAGHLAMTSDHTRSSHVTTSDSFRFDYVDLCVEETPLAPALRQQLRLDLRDSLTDVCDQQPAGSTSYSGHQQTAAR